MGKISKSALAQVQRPKPPAEEEPKPSPKKNPKASSVRARPHKERIPNSSHARGSVVAPTTQVLHSAPVQTGQSAGPTAEETARAVREFEAAMTIMGSDLDPPELGFPAHLHVLLAFAEQNAGAHQETLEKWNALSLETVALFYDDAKNSAFTTDDQQICIYLLYRIQGYSPSEAGTNCRFGPFYLGLMTPEKREKYIEDIKKLGCSGCPLTFPRVDTNVDEDTFVRLGEGSSNSVYQIEVFGRTFAWKPFNPDAEPSGGADRCGIVKETYYPMESHMLATEIARGLAELDGSGCVIGQATPAIINDKPGLLMDLAEGSNKQLGTHRYKSELPQNSKEYKACMKARRLFEDPATYAAQCKILNATAITFEGDRVFITGPLPRGSSRGRVDKALFKNADFLEKVTDAELVMDLIFHADRHLGNIFFSKPTDPAKSKDTLLTLIDLDDTFGLTTFEDIRKAGDSYGQHLLYFLAAPVKALSARAAKRLNSPEFKKIVNAAFADLETIPYSKARIDYCKLRIADRKMGAKTGEITVLKTEEDFLTKTDLSDPLTSLAARIKSIAT